MVRDGSASLKPPQIGVMDGCVETTRATKDGKGLEKDGGWELVEKKKWRLITRNMGETDRTETDWIGQYKGRTRMWRS